MSERDEIRRIVAEILELPLTELDDGASFTEVYFADSLERYRIVLALETFFDLHFPRSARQDSVCRVCGARHSRAPCRAMRGEGFEFRDH